MFSSSLSSSTDSNFGRSSMTYQTLGVPSLYLGHLALMCPGCRQRKQSPFSIHFLCSSAVSFPTLMTSTFMALGSWVLVGAEKEW